MRGCDLSGGKMLPSDLNQFFAKKKNNNNNNKIK